MIGKYKTRDGNLVEIDGVSQYFSFGQNVTILSGNVYDENNNVQIGHWDEFGNYRLNKLMGINDKHDLDIVSVLEENIQ